MSSTTIPTDVRLPSIPPSVVDAEGRATASRKTVAVDAVGAGSVDAVSTLLPWLAAGGAASPAGWLVSASASRATPAAGYATLVAKDAAGATKAKAPAPPKITGEWSFLTDASLSVEEKLAKFMQAVQKKLDDELTSKMEEYKAKYGEGGSETKKDDGGIFGTILKVIFPPVAALDAIFGGVDEFLVDALKSLGGPLLAALATAVGMPALAPAALKLGEGIAAMAGGTKAPATKKVPVPSKGTVKEVPVETPSTKAKGSSKDKAESGSPDERLAMLEIQRLVDKQNQLFTLVSNVMKNVHDTGMVAVQNLR